MAVSPVEIANILGVHKTIHNNLELADMITKGLPFSVVRKVKDKLQVTDHDVAVLLCISDRTLTRMRKSSEKLDTQTSDRLYRLARVFAQTNNIFHNDKKSRDWLRREQPGLGGRVALDMIYTEAGAREVEALLGRLEVGVYT